MRRIDIDDPAVDMDDSQRLTYEGELFTGEAAEYQGRAMISLDTYSEGILDGPSLEWYPDGAQRSVGAVRMGFPSGEFLEWHPNGQMSSKKVFSEDGQQLKEVYTWDEDGALASAWRDSDS
ncbi:hypothetical protein AB0K09_15880 [Streptomyces sp. NPDC049577]|uniref:toxin-antitoxin system YwqK family antitoxin n=1 Tax=Streptomyces sp. NPDC049577 TaxID=3155153 RepID=UPI00341A14DD